MSNSLVGIRDLHKVYHRGGERIDVLHGVNLDIPEGDFLALMGPSGMVCITCSMIRTLWRISPMRTR